MKKIYPISNTFSNKVSLYHLYFFLIALPFDRFYSELILISLFIHILIGIRKPNRIRLQPGLLLPVLLFLLTVSGLFYSDCPAQARMDIEKQLAFLLFPLIFHFGFPDPAKYKTLLLKVLGITCSVLILFLFYSTLQSIRYYKLPFAIILQPAFTNHNFSAPIGLHATYFSMFISLSLAAFLNTFFFSKKKGERIACLLGCIILLAGLFQLASRSVVLAGFITINFAFPHFLPKGKPKIKFFIISLSLSFLIIGLFCANPAFRNRYLTSLKQDLSIAGTPHNITDSRMKRWHFMTELISRHPIAGTGTGTEGDLLEKMYFDHQLYSSYLHKLNADNQYISLLLEHGMAGLALYLAILLLGFRHAVRSKDFLFFSFLLIISIVSFSENILDVNKGIFFFSFFFTLFIKSDSPFPGKGFRHRFTWASSGGNYSPAGTPVRDSPAAQKIAF